MSEQYRRAIERNLGLFTEHEQARLQRARVAIAGLGGVGGGTFLDLCRLGVGHFSIADPDTFADSDRNRQRGACSSSIGCNKTEVLTAAARSINPEVDIRAFPEGLTSDNADDLLAGAHFAVDALDYFALAERQALHDRARRRGLTVSLAAIFGFGASLAVFTPTGPGFGDLFGRVEGVLPLGHRLEFGRFLFPIIPDYLDVRTYLQALRNERPIPSLSPPASIAAGLQSMEVALCLTGRRAPVAVPRIKWVDLHAQRMRIIDSRSPLTRMRALLGMARVAQRLFADGSSAGGLGERLSRFVPGRRRQRRPPPPSR
jgi:hypothetical protein